MWLRNALIVLIFALAILVTIFFLKRDGGNDFAAPLIVSVAIFSSYLWFSGSLQDNIRTNDWNCWLHLAIFGVFILIVVCIVAWSYGKACECKKEEEEA